MINLDTKVEEIPRVGLAYQKRLKKMGIHTVKDLLFYLPNRYEDFSHIIPIKKIKLGYTVCVQGRVIEVKNTRTFKRFMSITEVFLEDTTGQIKAIWFNQPYLAKTLKEDDFVSLAGKVSLGKDGLYLNNPAYEKTDEITNVQYLTHTGRIVPVYPETKGLTSRWLRYIIKPLLASFYNKVPEILPNEIHKKYKFLPIKKALWQVHFPDSFEYADAAKARFSFEELFLLQLSVLSQKAKLQQKQSPTCKMQTDTMKIFTKSLPFSLTDSQKKCAYQILRDLEKPFPMTRILQGDVGSGKTVVATMAALNVVKNGYQTVFLAPTEILARQHFQSIASSLDIFKVKTGLLTAKNSSINNGEETYETSKQNLLEDLKNGQIDIVVGTHSLLQKNVEFKNLALVVVDEQHRFGVSQRADLVKNKANVPHLLSMTATPIPRTLALTIYGDLELSLLKEMPKNRKKIKTFIVQARDRDKAHQFIRSQVKEGKGVFVICPKIEPKNNFQATGQTYGSFVPTNYPAFLVNEVKAVKEEYEKLSKEIFPDLKVGMLYGKMKAKEKQTTMNDFRNGKVDILVSTSVVEVGIDIPRATVMMIEGAERFGLAQLHQFRGRVGRSNVQSYCFLFTTDQNQIHRKRLKALVASDNGFELAQKDLEIRGPGQIYGTQQWGVPDSTMQGMANIFLVEKTREAARELLEKDPDLSKYPLLKEALRHFEDKIHFE